MSGAKGGLKKGNRAVVKAVEEELLKHKFVFRTDVKSYYASIDHSILLQQLQNYLPQEGRHLLPLLRQFLQHLVHDKSKGTLQSIRKGISIGCPLSPLLGALFLKPLDDAMEKLMAKSGIFYVRFMDDWVVLAPTRWKLRRAIQQVNACLNVLKVHKHPDKTSIGRAENILAGIRKEYGKEGRTM